MSKKTRLELTWIGKDERPKLEPRILVESAELSHLASQRYSEDDYFDNLLIQGDNLLALKALEADYTGKVRCVYIDPPYNTGSAFAEYEDGIEHSLWLSLMRDRISILRNLLSSSGSFWMHLDDNEVHYAKVICDEIFGRENFITNMIWQKTYAVRSNANFVSSSHEHILLYSKDKNSFRMNFMPRSEKQAERYKNPDNDPRGPWQSVTMTISLVGGARGRQYAKTGHSENIYEVSSPSGKIYLPPPGRCWSRLPRGFEDLDRDGRIWWGPNGDNPPRLKMFQSEASEGILPISLWADGSEFGHNQDGVREIRELGVPPFPTPKPEKLLSKVISLATDPGDIVLDSFAGSGTTGAVAHKLGRRWIMVELGDHAVTHIAPRLNKVIDGDDPGGVTDAAEWKGGGGFRFHRLAPSLLERDRFGNWVISKQYNSTMLAEALCKHLGFMYAPSQDPAEYWRHGHSTETDFIYVTTQSLTYDALKKLSEEVGPKRTLLVCCKAFNAKEDSFPNLTVQKIPHSILAKCEWGRDDYSLRIANLPQATPSEEAAEKAEPNVSKSEAALPLFNNMGGK